MIATAAVFLAFLAPGHCNTQACGRRVHMRKIVRPYRAWLHKTAVCESGLGTRRPKWHISTGNGFYGGLQFTLQSWRAVGGEGYPHQASVLEQKYRGVKLLKLQGRNAWPVCG